MQGFRLMCALQWMAAAAGVLCALGLSTALGRGYLPLSKIPAMLAAGGLAPPTCMLLQCMLALARL